MLENTKVLPSLKNANVTAMGKWCIVSAIGSLSCAAKYLEQKASIYNIEVLSKNIHQDKRALFIWTKSANPKKHHVSIRKHQDNHLANQKNKE